MVLSFPSSIIGAKELIWTQNCHHVASTAVGLLLSFHYHHVWPHFAPSVCGSPLQETPPHSGVQAPCEKTCVWEHKGWSYPAVYAYIFESTSAIR